MPRIAGGTLSGTKNDELFRATVRRWKFAPHADVAHLTVACRKPETHLRYPHVLRTGDGPSQRRRWDRHAAAVASGPSRACRRSAPAWHTGSGLDRSKRRSNRARRPDIPWARIDRYRTCRRRRPRQHRTGDLRQMHRDETTLPSFTTVCREQRATLPLTHCRAVQTREDGLNGALGSSRCAIRVIDRSSRCSVAAVVSVELALEGPPNAAIAMTKASSVSACACDVTPAKANAITRRMMGKRVRDTISLLRNIEMKVFGNSIQCSWHLDRPEIHPTCACRAEAVGRRVTGRRSRPEERRARQRLEVVWIPVQRGGNP